jgi:proline iminopeptidase
MISSRTTTVIVLAWMLGLPLWSHASNISANDAFRAIRKITTSEGIEQQEIITIGGVPQWISIRARDRNAPILLVLHGGPGFTVSPVSDYYMRDWEEFFTVVQWDQRGAGKSHRSDDKESLAPTLTTDRLVRDTEELIELLRKRFKRDRVVLMAHSFGTILGVKVAQRRPDLLYAYVGMGQFVDAMRSEALGYEATLADARAEKNAEAIAALEAIAPFPDAARPERNLQNLAIERRWLAHYGGYFRAGGLGQHHAVEQLSPTYTAADLQTRQEAHDFIVQAMWKELANVNLNDAVQFRVPIIIMQGRHDRGTSSELVEKWHGAVNAPYTKLIWFEDSSHMVFEEEPGKLLVALATEVLPLTRPK